MWDLQTLLYVGQEMLDAMGGVGCLEDKRLLLLFTLGFCVLLMNEPIAPWYHLR